MDTGNMEFLRGQRILDAMDLCVTPEYLAEVTMNTLSQNISKFMPTTKRQYATDPIRIPQLKLVTYTITSDLLVDAISTSGGKTYDTKILFRSITYEDQETKQNITFTGSDNKVYNIAPISLSRINVYVSCSCLDFFWRFAKWNHQAQALLGGPPSPYTPKTDRPPVNPRKVPGICKHLIKTVQALNESGIVTS